jgi:DNA-binding GntR family transcriptional regulator
VNLDIKIDNNTLSELAYKKLKELIIENILKPGDRISQEKIAADLGISKIPLIQALSALHKEGLVEKLPRKGFFVRKLQDSEISDIFDIRSVFEMLGVSGIIDNFNPSLEKKLHYFLNNFERFFSEKKNQEYYDLDVDFHYFLINSSNNNLIKKLNEDMNILLLCFTKGWILDWEMSIIQHKEIINAILEKNKNKAEAMIRKHIKSLKEEYDKKNS